MIPIKKSSRAPIRSVTLSRQMCRFILVQAERRSLVEISLASERYYFLTFEGQYKTITELNHIMFFSVG